MRINNVLTSVALYIFALVCLFGLSTAARSSAEGIPDESWQSLDKMDEIHLSMLGAVQAKDGHSYRMALRSSADFIVEPHLLTNDYSCFENKAGIKPIGLVQFDEQSIMLTSECAGDSVRSVFPATTQGADWLHNRFLSGSEVTVHLGNQEVRFSTKGYTHAYSVAIQATAEPELLLKLTSI